MLSIWEPFGELGRFQREAQRKFNGFGPTDRERFSPAVDVFEEKEAIVLRAELPGVKRDEIDISLDGNVLTLKGERKLEQEEAGKRYHRVEREYGVFVRQFQLPTTADAEKIDAKLADGVLTLRVPKKDVAKPRRIDVAG